MAALWIERREDRADAFSKAWKHEVDVHCRVSKYSCSR